MFLGGIILPHRLQTVFIEAGMNAWKMGPVGFLVLVACCLIVVPHLNKKYFLPSDFFLTFQFLVLVSPLAALYSASGYIDDSNLALTLLIASLPTFVMLIFRKIRLVVPKIPIVESRVVVMALVLLIFVVIRWGYLNMPHSAGFSLSDSYSRRIEGRTLFVAGSLIAYLISMGTNLIAPFLSFWAGFRKNLVLLIVPFLTAIFFYWLLGIKATFLYGLAAYGLGWVVAHKKTTRIPILAMSVVFFLFGIFLIEWRINGYSYVADYFFRRVFSSNVQTQGYYFDMILNNPPEGWDFLFGLNKSDFSVTYFIGERYEGNSLGNANTNAFLVAFGQGGLAGYLGAVICIPAIFFFLDKLYLVDRNPVGLFVGFTFAVLILEQAYTTTLLSSGVGFMILLYYFMKPPPESYWRASEGRER